MERLLTWQRRLSPLLAPLGLAYGLAMRARREAHARGTRPWFLPPAPTISVGNMAWGGTGKTPLVQWLCAWAGARGLVPAVLTRGYKACPPAPHYLARPDSPVQYVGDEPLVLTRTCPKALVVVDPQRARAARWAARKWRPDLFVLDDGFQHLAVARHLDLVLLRPADLGRDWNRVIPAGPWREPASALAAAHAFLVKAAPGIFEALRPDLVRRLEDLGRPVFSFDIRAASAHPVAEPKAETDLAEEPFVLVTALGDPDQVLRSVEALAGRAPERHLAYGDHHAFTASDWADICKTADTAGVRLVLCTPKDAVKLEPLARQDQDRAVGLHVLRPELVFGPGLFTDQAFPAWWQAWWEGQKT